MELVRWVWGLGWVGLGSAGSRATVKPITCWLTVELQTRFFPADRRVTDLRAVGRLEQK